MERGQARTDAWSTRMREKYGLDTSDFGYDPARDDAQSGPSSHPIRQGLRAAAAPLRGHVKTQ